MLDPLAADAGAHAHSDASTRLALAEQLLLEAVYRSRAAQAASTALGTPDATPADRRCGLGHAPVPLGDASRTSEALFEDLDLSERAREVVGALWPDARTAPGSTALREALDAWIRAQDALDRKRNHFLRDFRARHGRGRAAYASDVAAAFDRGLDELNEHVRAQQREHARLVLALRPAGATHAR